MRVEAKAQGRAEGEPGSEVLGEVPKGSTQGGAAPSSSTGQSKATESLKQRLLKARARTGSNTSTDAGTGDGSGRGGSGGITVQLPGVTTPVVFPHLGSGLLFARSTGLKVPVA